MEEPDFKHFKGTVEYDLEKDQTYLVDDSGNEIYMQELKKIINSHEGFNIEIKFS